MTKSKFFDIVEGWKNYVFKSEHAEKVAKARASICSTCEHNAGKRCGKCGCVLSAKVRSMNSKCPINKW
jgi:hypothetical protein